MKKRAAAAGDSSRIGHNSLNNKALKHSEKPKAAPDPEAPAKQQQLKAYEEALGFFQQQKYQRAKQGLDDEATECHIKDEDRASDEERES